MKPLLLLLLALQGCTTFTTTQLHLTQQARKGVAIWLTREQSRDEQTQQEFAQKRRQLAQAFDADTRAQATLDPDWVIEARKAYAAALDVLNQAEIAALAANQSARRDAQATDLALQRLIDLQSVQIEAINLIPSGAKP